MSPEQNKPFRLPNIQRRPTLRWKFAHWTSVTKSMVQNVWVVAIVAGVIAIVIAAWLFHIG